MLFQGLVNLNPRKVEYLLSVSQSVQAKRLYLFELLSAVPGTLSFNHARRCFSRGWLILILVK
ncbi:hypothetical protein BCR59_28240 [Klebsiella pneumoniae]|nr:hypothetical protein BCR59_28240 [Klebsiella pneumoniae]